MTPLSSPHMRPEQTAAGQGFPRTYRVDARTRQVVNFFLVALAGLFLFLTVLQLARVDSRRSSLGDLIFVNGTIAAVLVWLGSGYNKRVLFYENAIEVVGWFYSRRLNFAEIRGRQTSGSSRLAFGYAYIFVPFDEGKRKLALPPYLHTDQFFRDWIKTIPKIRR